MISLYESILSSTKSGKSALATKIAEWWSKYYGDKGKFSVELIDSKLFVIMDDFARQPSQGSVEITAYSYNAMPSELAGIYYYRYDSFKEKELALPKITFTNLSGARVDLSNWDMSLAKEKPSIISIQIVFFNCNSIRLLGLPKYKDIFNVYFERGKDNRIHSVKSPLCNLSIHNDGSDMEELKDSVLREFIVSYRNFRENEYIGMPHIQSTRCIYIGRKWTPAIDEVLNNNKIEILRYVPDKDHFDDRKIKNKNLKIVPCKNPNWPNTKYKMIDLT